MQVRLVKALKVLRLLGPLEGNNSHLSRLETWQENEVCTGECDHDRRLTNDTFRSPIFPSYSATKFPTILLCVRMHGSALLT